MSEYTKVWLDYRRVSENYPRFTHVFCKENGPIIRSIISEMVMGLSGLYGEIVTIDKEPGENESIIMTVIVDESLGNEGYRISCDGITVNISANTHQGLLYGAFSLLRKLQCEVIIDNLQEEKVPSNPIRMLNHWDNMDGSIERGYSGSSFFFSENQILVNERTKDYARMIACVGINSIAVNNVNVKGEATKLITANYREKLKALADVFYSYGIKLYLSLNFAAPIEIGKLNTADPLDERVAIWWKKTAEDIYTNIPYFGGFLVKADSEGREGPFTYGRTHSDGANMLADAVDCFGGIIIWRCFVYNCRQDWRDRKTDRAKAAYDNFMPLDGQFRDNVILQIKNGPMDFQVREPVNPLFGGLKATNMMLEVQIAQEYTGQQIHVCYLIPWFKAIINYRTYCKDNMDTVGDLIAGRTYNQSRCGITAVCNTGDNENWTGHDLATANLYGFGRLSFDINLSAEEIADEWIKLTFGRNPEVLRNIKEILMMSWPAYEEYTSPLGIGWMVNPNQHYGPNPDGYEYDSWGTYHRANHYGIGIDRSSKGTGYSAQYNTANAQKYEIMGKCPEELLLFFHYVPYDYKLSNGKTLIQYIYDSHFEGVEKVREMIILWQQLSDSINPNIYQRVLSRMKQQLTNAVEWRDVINSYFYRKSGIADDKQRKIYI
jgi:alpha-glucuronidase